MCARPTMSAQRKLAGRGRFFHLIFALSSIRSGRALIFDVPRRTRKTSSAGAPAAMAPSDGVRSVTRHQHRIRAHQLRASGAC